MNKNLLGEFYVCGGTVSTLTDSSSIRRTGSVYEVLRLIDGSVLFLDDHLERLRHSLSELGMNYPGDEEIFKTLGLLCQANSIRSANILISLYREGAAVRLCGSFIPFQYPHPEDYQNGVKTAVFPYDRFQPGIKRFDADFRSRVQNFILEQGVYEALLVNPQGQITEGSRSNVFFIPPEGDLLTCPMNYVLPGITRKHVFQICRKAGLEIKETMMHTKELGRMESCFITGTSPKVLPVSEIDHIQLQPRHPVLRKLIEEFDKLIKDNLRPILKDSAAKCSSLE